MLAGDCVTYLVNRLRIVRIVDHHRRHPDLSAREVTALIVILGSPRTPTTALSYLLDQDPQWRSLLSWENASRTSLYSLADFGLERADLLARFADYINAFDVALDASR